MTPVKPVEGSIDEGGAMNELRSAATPDGQEAMRWIGMRVDDIHGKPIGRLSDVWNDPATNEPTWLLVRYGGGADACTLIPLREASRARKRVWVHFDRDFVRGGPWVHRHTKLSAKASAAFAAYYGLPVPASESKPRRGGGRFELRPRPVALRRTPETGFAAVSARRAVT
jgi:hypothetical protein